MIRRELFWFLVIGCSVTLIDFCIYNGLLRYTSLTTEVAKAGGFVIGTFCAYIANRLLTFRHQQPRAGSMLRFALLYGGTLIANVSINALMLKVVHGFIFDITLAFVLATIVSASLNFIGMKLFVFPTSQDRTQ